MMGRRKIQASKRRRGLDVHAIEYRPWVRDAMTPSEVAEFDQIWASGDVERAGIWLLQRGFEFRLDLGPAFFHVTPA